MTLAIESKSFNGNIFRPNHVREYLGYLIEIIQIKRKLRISVSDITLLLGLYDNIHRTRFGILLNDLCDVGLAERVRNTKPKKYRLKPTELWLKFVSICDFKCESDSSICSLSGICPYWVLKNGYS